MPSDDAELQTNDARGRRRAAADRRPSIIAKMQVAPLAGLTDQIAKMQVAPFAGLTDQIAKMQVAPFAGLTDQLREMSWRSHLVRLPSVATALYEESQSLTAAAILEDAATPTGELGLDGTEATVWLRDVFAGIIRICGPIVALEVVFITWHLASLLSSDHRTKFVEIVTLLGFALALAPSFNKLAGKVNDDFDS